MAFCSQCGSSVDDNATFCPNCGATVNNAQTGAQASQSMPNGQGQAAQSMPNGQGQATNGSQKSRIAAGVLAILLGSLGVHNFYLGKTGRAVVQLIVSILGACLFGLGPLAMWIWAIIEGIFILTRHEGYTTDAKGIPLRD